MAPSFRATVPPCQVTNPFCSPSGDLEIFGRRLAIVAHNRDLDGLLRSEFLLRQSHDYLGIGNLAMRVHDSVDFYLLDAAQPFSNDFEVGCIRSMSDRRRIEAIDHRSPELTTPAVSAFEERVEYIGQLVRSFVREHAHQAPTAITPNGLTDFASAGVPAMNPPRSTA